MFLWRTFKAEEEEKMQEKIPLQKGRKKTWVETFFLMGESERELVAAWHKNQTGELTKKQQGFLITLGMALKIVDYDYRIAVMEPSRDEYTGKICYQAIKPVLRNLNALEWKKLAKEFLPSHCSRLANEYELTLWYAYRIAKGFWSFDYVVNDSSDDGNYWNSPKAKHYLEFTGASAVGGFCDGVGNTGKLVTATGGNFVVYGGNYLMEGFKNPVASKVYKSLPDKKDELITGVVILRTNI